MKKKRSPRFYAVIMALQPAAVVLSFVLGVWLDSLLFRGFYDRPHPVGHPVPIFSLFVPILVTLSALIVFAVMLIGLCRALRRQKREREGRVPPQEGRSSCPRCGGRLFSTNVCIRCGKKLR